MSSPCRIRPAGTDLARRARTFVPLALVGLLALASALPVRGARAATASDDLAEGPRVWVGGGPFLPHDDDVHWNDPRGGPVTTLGFGIPVCPAAVLGFEADGWFGSYAAARSPEAGVKDGSRMHGRYFGIGPTAIVRTSYQRWDPWVSATLLFVNEHLSFTRATGGDGTNSAWKGTFAVGAGAGYRLWPGTGLELRYQHIPLDANFDVYSNGSADVTVDAVMLSLFHEGPWPKWLGGRSASD